MVLPRAVLTVRWSPTSDEGFRRHERPEPPRLPDRAAPAAACDRRVGSRCPRRRARHLAHPDTPVPGPLATAAAQHTERATARRPAGPGALGQRLGPRA